MRMILKRPWTRWLAIIACLLLAACTTGTRLAYNNLGTLARWEAGKYVDMTSDQKAAFDAEFKPVWDWHRQTQLPRYAVELRAIARLLDAGNPDRATIDRVGEQIEAFANAVGDHAQPGLARLLARVTDEQVQTLLAARRREFDKTFRKQSARTLDQWKEKSQRESEDAVKTWIGPLSAEQKALLAQGIAEDIARGEYDPTRIRRERLRQLGKFEVLLAERHQPDFQQRLKTFGDPVTPAEKQATDEEQERNKAQLAALAATLDATQRQFLSKRLRSFADDCDALTAHGGNVSPPLPAEPSPAGDSHA